MKYNIGMLIVLFFFSCIGYGKDKETDVSGAMKLISITPSVSNEFRNQVNPCFIRTTVKVKEMAEKREWVSDISLEIQVFSSLYYTFGTGNSEFIPPNDVVMAEKMSERRIIKIVPQVKDNTLDFIFSDDPFIRISYPKLFLQMIRLTVQPMDETENSCTYSIYVHYFNIPMLYNNKFIELLPGTQLLKVGIFELKYK